MDKLGAGLGARIGLLLAAATAALCSAALCTGNASARTFTRALTDDVWDSLPAQWVPRTQHVGAGLVLLEVDWVSVEPSAPPAGADPTNPAGPQYDFRQLDSWIKNFNGSGVSVALLVTDAPAWAEGPGGTPGERAAGAWEPNATAFGQFATALARRYSGGYPDPASPGHALPRVKYFQAWAEANFTVHLAPQWTFSGGAWVPFAPAMYRTMLNAFYAGVKSVNRSDVVITTGFGPYGDLQPGACSGPNTATGNGCRMPPAMFARELLCLHGHALKPESCPDPAHFDALAMDPYEVSSPTTAAFNPDDVSAPDLWKLTRALKKAVRLHRALPRAHKQLWVTEFSYDSNPPNPGAVSLAKQARWLDEALFLFWKQGVSTAVWYLVRDQAPTFNSTDYYSGLYYFNGNAKPAAEAFRFPLVVWPNGRHATVWGIAPQTGRLKVQRQRGRSWKTLLRMRVSTGRVFTRSISSRLRGHFRAVVNGEISPVWTR
jgi:hypothetical protein